MEWNLYTPTQRQPIIDEYQQRFGEITDSDHWLEYLREKLEITNYWRLTGLD